MWIRPSKKFLETKESTLQHKLGKVAKFVFVFSFNFGCHLHVLPVFPHIIGRFLKLSTLGIQLNDFKLLTMRGLDMPHEHIGVFTAQTVKVL